MLNYQPIEFAKWHSTIDPQKSYECAKEYSNMNDSQWAFLSVSHLRDMLESFDWSRTEIEEELYQVSKAFEELGYLYMVVSSGQF